MNKVANIVFKTLVICFLGGILFFQYQMFNLSSVTFTDLINAKTQEERIKLIRNLPLVGVRGAVEVEGTVSVSEIENTVIVEISN